MKHYKLFLNILDIKKDICLQFQMSSNVKPLAFSHTTHII